MSASIQLHRKEMKSQRSRTREGQKGLRNEVIIEESPQVGDGERERRMGHLNDFGVGI